MDYVSQSFNFNNNIRTARVVISYDESSISANKKYGYLEVVWLDGAGNVNTPIQVCLPGYSWNNGCGIMYMPKEGDIVACLIRPGGPPIVVGYFPYKLAEAVNTQFDNLGYMRPLVSGEVLVKSGQQSEIYLDRNGSIKFTTNNQKATPIQYESPENKIANAVGGQTQYSKRVPSLNNLQTEFLIGVGTLNIKKGDKTFEKELINSKEIRARLRVTESLTKRETFIYTGNIEALKFTPVSDIIKIDGTYLGRTAFFIKDSDFNVSSDGKSVIWGLRNKHPDNGTAYTVTYSVEVDRSRFHIDEDGNYLIKGKSLTLESFTKDPSSGVETINNSVLLNNDGSVVVTGSSLTKNIVNTSILNAQEIDLNARQTDGTLKSSIVIKNDGTIVVNGSSLTEIIQDTITQTVKDLLVNASGKIVLKGNNVYMGDEAGALKLFNELLEPWLTKHVHTSTAPGTLTTPPTLPITPAMMTTKLKAL